MEKLISIKPEYASLEKIEVFLKKETSFDIKQEYDHWEIRTDENDQMKKCIVVKKNNMHGIRLYFKDDNTLKTNHLTPNKLMNSFFGKNQQKYRSILSLVTEAIQNAILLPFQKKAFNEMVDVFDKITAT